MSAHLGPAVTAFVDGELDHERREEVLVHLTHCDACRAEVDALRSLKGALRRTDPMAPDDLTARVLASTAGQPVAAPRAVGPRRHARLRRTAIGGAAVAAGVLGALGVAGPPPEREAPMDPTGPGMVIEHVSTANEVPFVGAHVTSVRSR